jgi:NTP pyrophosphatase (non-canonical NTP hydrolase)
MNTKEKEILIILQEECAEVIQEASKIFRFGFESCYPTADSANGRERLTLELGQVLCMINLLIERNVVDEGAMLTAMEAKKIKLKKWSTIFDDDLEIRSS